MSLVIVATIAAFAIPFGRAIARAFNV